jgi:hypothetical protein
VPPSPLIPAGRFARAFQAFRRLFPFFARV